MDTILLIISLLGGIGLFLYVMNIMGESLKNAAGDKLKGFFEKITSNPVKGVLTGTIVTAIIQSSSATTVMVVGFVNAGIMNLFQAAGIIYGANIGTTITGQIVALNLSDWAPLFVAIGVGVYLLSKKTKTKEISNIILGFGLLFIGLNTMKSSMAPFTDAPVFKDLVVTLSGSPFLGVMVGVLLTFVLQSSSATIGVLIALASTGAIDLNIAVPVLLGDNIGTCTTALISSIGTTKTARKAALLHLMFNVTGTIIFLIILNPYKEFLLYLGGDIGKQVANAHTIFNVVNVCIQLPFIKFAIKFINKLVPGEDEKIKQDGAIFIEERLLETPALAISQAVKEVGRMGNLARTNFKLAKESFFENDAKKSALVYENEKLIDKLEEDIANYIVKLSHSDLNENQEKLVKHMYYVLNDIERIGDHSENIAEITEEKVFRKVKLSSAAIKELEEIFQYAEYAITESIDSFIYNDDKKAYDVMRIEEKIDKLEEQLKESDINRLNSSSCNPYSSIIFLDLISNLERIGDHSLNIAEVIINK